MCVGPNAVSEGTEVVSSFLNETTLYYTYSTIAQTLAGAFGILGAFVLFHLQGINQSIKGTCKYIIDLSNKPSEEIRFVFSRENWQDFFEALNIFGIKTLLPDLEHQDDKRKTYESLKEGLEAEIEYRKSIIEIVKSVTIFTSAAIIISIIALPLVPKLVNYPIISGISVGITIGITIGCVRYYILIIFNAIHHKVYRTASVLKKKKKESKNK